MDKKRLIIVGDNFVGSVLAKDGWSRRQIVKLWDEFQATQPGSDDQFIGFLQKNGYTDMGDADFEVITV